MSSHLTPRPRRVTLLALGVLSIAGSSSVRLFLVVRQWAFLDSLPGVSPLYITTTGLIWLFSAAPLAWGLWRGRTWALRYTQATALAYAAYFWLERLVLFERTSDQVIHLPANTPFALAVTLLLLYFVYWSTASAKSKLFFGVNHERSP